MDNLLHLRLRAFQHDPPHDRDYHIRMGCDLLRKWYVTIIFGRYATKGTAKTTVLESQEEAFDLIHAKLRRRLSSPKRIGCAYQLVSLEGDPDLISSLDEQIIQRFSWLQPTSGIHCAALSTKARLRGWRRKRDESHLNLRQGLLNID